ncbi:hypothetical protein [Bacillus licheniformis]|nr:hypothetical protein [Bacillus licheniformis]
MQGELKEPKKETVPGTFNQKESMYQKGFTGFLQFSLLQAASRAAA